jgi:hypothetical protein
MKERRWWKSTLLVVLGISVAYFLGLGPIFVTRNYNKFPQLQPWFDGYIQPANHLARFRPLHVLMEWYVGVWLRITDAPEGTE